MNICNGRTKLPAGVTYNWQVYLGFNLFCPVVYGKNSEGEQTVSPNPDKYIINPSGFYDIIAGTNSSSSSANSVSASDYDTNPTLNSYWLNLLSSGLKYRLKVTINHVSIYSNIIELNVMNESSVVSIEGTGLTFSKENLSADKSITSESNLNVTVGTGATLQLIPSSFWLKIIFWLIILCQLKKRLSIFQ